MNILPQLIVCHLIGDFLFQCDYMQAKSRNSFICSVHVLWYSFPFIIYVVTMNAVHRMPIPYLALTLIFIEHWLQDRFALHLKWMKLIDQTPPEKWPTGPLCVDQAMHIAFIWLFSALYV